MGSERRLGHALGKALVLNRPAVARTADRGFESLWAERRPGPSSDDGVLPMLAAAVWGGSKGLAV